MVRLSNNEIKNIGEKIGIHPVQALKDNSGGIVLSFILEEIISRNSR